MSINGKFYYKKIGIWIKLDFDPFFGQNQFPFHTSLEFSQVFFYWQDKNNNKSSCVTELNHDDRISFQNHMEI